MNFEYHYRNRLTSLSGFNKDGNFVPIDITDDVYQYIVFLLCPEGHKEHHILKDINVTRIDNAIIIASNHRKETSNFSDDTKELFFRIGGNNEF